MIYRNRIFDDTKPAPDAALVRSIEKSLGVSLPPDYVKFISICNGGYAAYEFDIEFDDGTSEPLGFGALYSFVSPGSWETLPFELDEDRKLDGFPPQGVLPIARDGGGSKLYLDLRDGYRVVAFVSGLPAWTGLRGQDSLVTVAKSFDDYLDGLYLTNDMIVDSITHFDPRYNKPELMAELFDTGSPDWRTVHAEIWDRHVVNRSDG
ncbi:SMI1 / KNR4 family protein [Rubripirellula obstinata]|uniref:SMI1 / KNR4 family protein n=1 Tax=Rubripirellula obstinata TaxID=406547 RepID=A0A5B1CBC2_9BACT|nr:SMI1/KNR4 family protein [Rubripirellula obstinata]KAA1257521.1 SMI1 / KNR4 family protein [Rubripirellula obstinata]